MNHSLSSCVCTTNNSNESSQSNVPLTRIGSARDHLNTFNILDYEQSPVLLHKALSNFKKNPTHEDFTNCTTKEGQAVCKILVKFKRSSEPHKMQQQSGTGFLGIYNGKHALFTNCHVFGEGLKGTSSDLQCELHFKSGEFEQQYIIDIKKCSYFACPLLDMIYVEFNDINHRNIIEDHALFLDLNDQMEAGEGEKIYILHRPVGSPCTKITKGSYAKDFNFNFTHKVSTLTGSSGSPVIIERGHLVYIIGIHRGEMQDDYNVGVSMRDILRAIDTFTFYQPTYIRHMSSFLPVENCREKLVILEVTWMRFFVNIHKCKYPSYVCNHARFSLDQNSYDLDITLLPTTHGLYWAAASIITNVSDFMWMELTQSRIISRNKYHNYELKTEDKLAVFKHLSETNIIDCLKLFIL